MATAELVAAVHNRDVGVRLLGVWVQQECTAGLSSFDPARSSQKDHTCTGCMQRPPCWLPHTHRSCCWLGTGT